MEFIHKVFQERIAHEVVSWNEHEELLGEDEPLLFPHTLALVEVEQK